MPTEEESSEAIADTAADASEPSGERSPRHAARRRSLLQRLHMPVGKAVALAAVPSAVFLGTGFTSPLAKADPQPENPFSGDSCVEMPDQAGEDEPAEDAAGDGAAGDEAGSGEADAGDAGRQEQDPATGEGSVESAEPDETSEAEETAEPTEQPRTDAAEETDGGETAEPDAAEDTGGDAAEETTEETGEEPADGELLGSTGDTGTGEEGASTTDGDGDGLLGGLGDALEDLLNPGGDDDEDDGSSGGQDGGSSGGQDGSAGGAGGSGSDGGSGSSGGGDGGATADPDQSEGTAEDRNQDDERDEEDATDEDASGSDASAEDPLAPNEEGQVPFPCPEEKQVSGVDEETALTLPDDPWYLEASSLTLYGLHYHGVVNVTTADGTVKQVLKFTADEIDIGDLHQIVDGADGVRRHVSTAPGSVSTFRNGQVTMYTERLEGNLFGLIPIVFDPEHQPPLDLPIANFTNVFVTQAGQFGGELTLHGMNSYITEDGPTVPR